MMQEARFVMYDYGDLCSVDYKSVMYRVRWYIDQ